MYLQPILHLKSIKLIKKLQSDLAEILADEYMLEEVYLNLFYNAIEAMPNGGEIEVLTRMEGKWVVVQIKHTGIGIASEDLFHIFKPYWTNKAKGTGLGLFIAQDIIEKHSGTIRVESQPEKGTTFTIRFLHSSSPVSGEDTTASPISPEEKKLSRLIKALKDKSWDVLMPAVYALGKRAIEPLIKALRDKDDDVRIRALYALSNIGDKRRAVKPLIMAALRDENPYVCVFAATILNNICNIGQPKIPDLMAIPHKRKNFEITLLVLLDYLPRRIKNKFISIREFEVKWQELMLKVLKLSSGAQQLLKVILYLEVLKNPYNKNQLNELFSQTYQEIKQKEDAWKSIIEHKSIDPPAQIGLEIHHSNIERHYSNAWIIPLLLNYFMDVPGNLKEGELLIKTNWDKLPSGEVILEFQTLPCFNPEFQIEITGAIYTITDRLGLSLRKAEDETDLYPIFKGERHVSLSDDIFSPAELPMGWFLSPISLAIEWKLAKESVSMFKDKKENKEFFQRFLNEPEYITMRKPSPTRNEALRTELLDIDWYILYGKRYKKITALINNLQKLDLQLKAIGAILIRSKDGNDKRLRSNYDDKISNIFTYEDTVDKIRQVLMRRPKLADELINIGNDLKNAFYKQNNLREVEILFPSSSSPVSGIAASPLAYGRYRSLASDYSRLDQGENGNFLLNTVVGSKRICRVC